MNQNKNNPIVEAANIVSPQDNKNILASFFLLSKNLTISEPIVSGISLPIFISFSELYENMKYDSEFRNRFQLFTMNKTRLINVVENYNDDLLFEDIYSITDDETSPKMIEVITISYLDLINNKQIIDILNSNNATEFNQHLFFFEDCTWLKIKNMLASNNITLTVGSNTRRQFLSPIEYKFSLMLICLGYSLEHISKIFLNYEQYDRQQIKIAINNKKQVLKEEKKLQKCLKKNSKTLTTNSSTNNNKQSDYSKNKINSPFTSSSSKREFSTSIVLWSSNDTSINSSNNTNLSIKGERKREIKWENLPIKGEIRREYKSVNLKDPVKIKKDLNTDSLILTYLEDLTDLLQFSENDNEYIKKQRQIENDWVLNVKDKLNDPKYLNHNVNKTIKKAFESLEIFYSNRKQLNKLFGTIAPEFIKIETVIIAFAIITTYILKHKSAYTALAGKVGAAVLSYVFYKKIYGKTKSDYYNSFNDFLKQEQIDNKKQVLLGDIFIERFIDIEMVNRLYEKDTRKVYLVVNDDYISDLVETAIIYPPSLPMICKPLIWDTENFGGFLRNEFEKHDLITGSIFKHGHKIENRENLFNAINYFNNVKFRVNNELLSYIKKEGEFLLEYLINKDINKDIWDNKTAQDNKKLIQQEKIAKLNIDITMKIANLYKKIPFYLPTNADWRGRIYTSSFFLSYQGSDFSTALIQFWDGETLTKEGLDNLFIYGANSYNENGINKKSLETRIKWVNDNYNKILEMDKEFILNAESPLVFTAFCLSLIQLDKNPKAKIYTPIFLDATCSGIQHFAGLLKDYDLGSKVNLIAQNSTDNVGDIYSFILDPINNEINNFGKENQEFDHFVNLKFNRKDIKQPTMTKLYNVTIHGMKEQLKSNFDSITIQSNSENSSGLLTEYEIASTLESNLDKIYINKKTLYKAPGIGKPVLLKAKDLYQIAKIINDTIFVLFPSLKQVYDYLIGISNLLSKAKLPISWSTPSGLQITQNYLKSEVHKASIKSGNVAKTIVMRQSNRAKRDNRKQKQGIIPNVIHSLDSSHIINLVNTAKSINLTPIITIHDCFGTHPNKMNLVNNLVLKEFISLYTKEDFLLNFNKQILKSLVDNNYEIFTTYKLDKEEGVLKYFKIKYIMIEDEKIFIPNLPNKGNLDIDSIINSKYFIT